MLRTLFVLILAIVLNACTASPNSVLDMRLAVENPRFGDHDPVDWPGRTPWVYPVHGIDVSKYQGDIDWAAVKASGIDFLGAPARFFQGLFRAARGDFHRGVAAMETQLRRWEKNGSRLRFASFARILGQA